MEDEIFDMMVLICISKKAMQKRIVSVPIKDLEGPRLKGENASPPSDSWAWRKYGQKPIKGSPYPRYIRNPVHPLPDPITRLSFIYDLFLLSCSNAFGQILSVPEERKIMKIPHKKLWRREFAAEV